MCDDYQEKLYWIRRMEQMRKEEELKKQSGTPKPVKPAAPAEADVKEHEPVPA